MQHKRLKLSVVFLLGLGLIGLQAQENVNATGGNASGSGGSASYSVGQVVYTSNTETDGSVTVSYTHLDVYKRQILDKSNLFEGLNFRYFGPIDGHDILHLVSVLQDMKRIPGPKLLHCMTVKGKGLRQAEQKMCIRDRSVCPSIVIWMPGFLSRTA